MKSQVIECPYEGQEVKMQPILIYVEHIVSSLTQGKLFAALLM